MVVHRVQTFNAVLFEAGNTIVVIMFVASRQASRHQIPRRRHTRVDLYSACGMTLTLELSKDFVVALWSVGPQRPLGQSFSDTIPWSRWYDIRRSWAAAAFVGGSQQRPRRLSSTSSLLTSARCSHIPHRTPTAAGSANPGAGCTPHSCRAQPTAECLL